MKVFTILFILLAAISFPVAAKPNIILIVADNLGYGDVGCFGSTVNRTPNLDQMATEGIKLTSFYVGSSVCTPSRAAFMTGCYPARVSMELSGTRRLVLQPVAQKGLAPGETTMAEVLKERGYATMCIGKWHLGDQPLFLPTRQGFDSWLGVPYSEDMIPGTAPRLGEMWPPVPLVKDETVIEAPVDPDTLTKRYTVAAQDFIKENKEQPFFLYLPHAVPGSSKTAFASREFRDQSESGAYGACIEELDWSVGEIIDCLKREGIDENTIIVWTSDNGAFHGRREPPYGQNTPLRGTGGTAFEGGFRVPCIVRWPESIKAGSVSNELVTSMDLLPTFAKLGGEDFEAPRPIDGKDIWSILSGNTDAQSPHDVFYYYRISQLRAIRSGKWKLHLPVNRNAFRLTHPAKFDDLQLYDLEADISETTNVAGNHPDVVEKLMGLADDGRQKLGDLNRLGSEQRAAGWVDNVQSLRLENLPAKRAVPSDATPLISPGMGTVAWSASSQEGWATTSSVALDAENTKQLFVSPVSGDAVFHNVANEPTGKKAKRLATVSEYGDIEAHFEFQIATKSNSGIYFMDRYEVQILDSFGKANEALKHGDCGGIYERWDDSRENKGYEGTKPLSNACRPAGEWQSLDVIFRAPRFNEKGEKIEDAMFVKVQLNGVTIHENVKCSGPTRGGKRDEVAKAPITIQGDHGPVAFRNAWLKVK